MASRSTLAAVLAATLAAASATTKTAQAEGKLLRSQPADNAVLSAPPAKVEAWFSDGVVGKLISLAVVDSAGNRVDERDVQQGFLDKNYVYATLKSLSPGTYTARYRVVIAGDDDEGEDESVVSGKFKFTVN